MGRDGEAITNDRDEYASWGRRVVAQIIDAVIVIAGFAILAVLVAAAGSAAIGIVAGISFYIGYFVVGHGSRSGQTLGKKLLGIAVKGDIAFGRISYARAFGRLLSLFVLGLIPLVNILNLLSPLWDSENQAWHDKLADTVVVKAA
jgi:uncharacterized RDD family membrane protein YckC